MEPPSCLAGVGARPKWNGSTTLGLITITAIFSDPQFTFKNIFNFHYCHIYCPEPVPSDVWQWQKVQNQLKRHMLSIENRALISDSSSCLLDMDESSSRPSKIENYRYQLCICHFLFHTAVLQYTQLLICCFNFCWIRILNNNSESGSRKKFHFHVDPDPHHCFIRFFSRSFLMVRIFLMDDF